MDELIWEEFIAEGAWDDGAVSGNLNLTESSNIGQNTTFSGENINFRNQRRAGQSEHANASNRTMGNSSDAPQHSHRGLSETLEDSAYSSSPEEALALQHAAKANRKLDDHPIPFPGFNSGTAYTNAVDSVYKIIDSGPNLPSPFSENYPVHQVTSQTGNGLPTSIFLPFNHAEDFAAAYSVALSHSNTNDPMITADPAANEVTGFMLPMENEPLYPSSPYEPGPLEPTTQQDNGFDHVSTIIGEPTAQHEHALNLGASAHQFGATPQDASHLASTPSGDNVPSSGYVSQFATTPNHESSAHQSAANSQPASHIASTPFNEDVPLTEHASHQFTTNPQAGSQRVSTPLSESMSHQGSASQLTAASGYGSASYQGLTSSPAESHQIYTPPHESASQYGSGFQSQQTSTPQTIGETFEEDGEYTSSRVNISTGRFPAYHKMMNPTAFEEVKTDTMFSSAAEAHAASRHEYHAPYDNTIPTHLEQRKAIVKALIDAMTSTDLAQDNQGMIKPFVDGKYSAKRVEATCWKILDNCIKRHTEGSLLVEYDQKPKQSGEFKCFADRMREIIMTLATQKTICKHALDAPYLAQLVDDPIAALKRVVANKSLNKRKGDIMNAGKKALDGKDKKSNTSSASKSQSTQNQMLGNAVGGTAIYTNPVQNPAIGGRPQVQPPRPAAVGTPKNSSPLSNTQSPSSYTPGMMGRPVTPSPSQLRRHAAQQVASSVSNFVSRNTSQMGSPNMSGSNSPHNPTVASHMPGSNTHHGHNVSPHVASTSNLFGHGRSGSGKPTPKRKQPSGNEGLNDESQSGIKRQRRY